jgi:hypothetical protein
MDVCIDPSGKCGLDIKSISCAYNSDMASDFLMIEDIYGMVKMINIECGILRILFIK